MVQILLISKDKDAPARLLARCENSHLETSKTREFDPSSSLNLDLSIVADAASYIYNTMVVISTAHGTIAFVDWLKGEFGGAKKPRTDKSAAGTSSGEDAFVVKIEGKTYYVKAIKDVEAVEKTLTQTVQDDAKNAPDGASDDVK